MRIEHIAMYCDDIERARAFFVAYFGARSNDMYRNERTGFSSYFLTFDGGARLEIMNIPDISVSGAPEIRTGYAHIAFSVGGREKVDALTKRLREDGYKVASEPRTTGDGYYESCVLDAEGNLIEITE